jgi:hypothetical protein
VNGLQDAQLETATDIHSLVQNAHDVDLRPGSAIKYNVRTGQNLEVPTTNFIALAPKIGIVRHRFDSCFDFTDVPFGLLLVPLANRISPDLIEILSCQGREGIARHYLAGFDFRLRAIKASKSKGFDGQLFSPAISADRSAASFASSSSRSLRLARTTSLAEPSRPCDTCVSMKLLKCSPKINDVFLATDSSSTTIDTIIWYQTSTLPPPASESDDAVRSLPRVDLVEAKSWNHRGSCVSEDRIAPSPRLVSCRCGPNACATQPVFCPDISDSESPPSFP